MIQKCAPCRRPAAVLEGARGKYRPKIFPSRYCTVQIVVVGSLRRPIIQSGYERRSV
jgi:hypothetical protein